MTTHLEACIEALERAKTPFNEREHAGLHAAIAIVERIFGAEPSEEEIRQLAITLFEERISGTRNVSYPSGYIKIAKAALLTAFPQQDKL